MKGTRANPPRRLWGVAVLATLAATPLAYEALTASAWTRVLWAALFLGIALGSAGYVWRHLTREAEALRQVKGLHGAMLEVLALAIDAKDQVTLGHARRVQIFASELAQALRLPESTVTALEQAALLHDVGLLAIPEYILHKPGPLTEAEWAKVRLHPVTGAALLERAPFPAEVVEAVRHHHERWDGGGYPAGLRGEEIPLGARILAVVDCYDALLSERPYRLGYSREEARTVLEREAGQSLDPSLVGHFLLIVEAAEAKVKAVEHGDPLLSRHAPSADEPLESQRAAPHSITTPLGDIAAARREIVSLYEIAQTLGASLNLDEVLPIISAKLERIVGFGTCVIYLVEGEDLRAVHARGRHAERLRGVTLGAGEGLSGWVARTGVRAVGGKPALDLRPFLGTGADEFTNSAILPLKDRDGSTRGVLALYTDWPGGYSDDALRVLDIVAQHAGVAVGNALDYERTHEVAHTDLLTGLRNSRFLYAFLDRELQRAAQTGQPLAILMMDLDRFKRVNDLYGHHIGDEMLKKVASRVQSELRYADDLLARYAGDEFIAVLPNISVDHLPALTARIKESVENCRMTVRKGRVVGVGVSIGEAVFPRDGRTAEDLFMVADQRMYRDKQSRREQESYHPEVIPLLLRNAEGIGDH
ncbi:MAG: diguanylate cyclase [Gemmatimonadetes bacterium]|nr:diguanylate cyclase [Gemmatimonadota bacterium]